MIGGIGKIAQELAQLPLSELAKLAPWALEVREEILADLGGAPELTRAALLDLDMAIMELVYVRAIDAWMATVGSIAGSGGRHRTILDQRTRLKASAEKTLRDLGALTRKPAKDVSILEAWRAPAGPAQPPAEASVTDPTIGDNPHQP